MNDAMTWEQADQAQIDDRAHYLVQTNGDEWRDFDLAVLRGALVRHRLDPDYVRGRPMWIAKIKRPALTSATRQTRVNSEGQ